MSSLSGVKQTPTPSSTKTTNPVPQSAQAPEVPACDPNLPTTETSPALQSAQAPEAPTCAPTLPTTNTQTIARSFGTSNDFQKSRSSWTPNIKYQVERFFEACHLDSPEMDNDTWYGYAVNQYVIGAGTDEVKLAEVMIAFGSNADAAREFRSLVENDPRAAGLTLEGLVQSEVDTAYANNLLGQFHMSEMGMKPTGVAVTPDGGYYVSVMAG